MERRVVCTVIISPGVPLSADPAAVKDRGRCIVVPPQVHDWASLQQYLRSAYTIPDGSFYDILDAFEDGYAWFKLDGIDSLPDSTSWFVKVTLPSSDSVALTSILDKIEKIAADVSATRAEVSSTRNDAEDFGFLTRALKIVGPVSEDINGNVIDSDSLLGDEDERYEEQQRDRYTKEVEVKDFLAKVGGSLPDDLGDDMVMPQTLDEPKRKKFRQLEQPGPYPPTGGSSSSGVQYERPTKAQLLRWTLGPRILENEDDVANMADLEAFNLF